MKTGSKVQVVFFCNGCCKIEMVDTEWAGSREKTSKAAKPLRCKTHGKMDVVGWVEIGGTDE